ncbi:MAG: UbiH/UbiF/VisC/COQ6 family ubiquinone biosynthesis hydroxylase [Pseudomonadota bacterium]
MKKIKVDICVAGGGMVGLTACALLVKSGFKVCLVEPRHLEETFHDKPSLTRVSAINLLSRRLFEQLSVWDKLSEPSFAPYYAMQLWDAEGQGQLSLDASTMGFDTLGHIASNDALRAALWYQLKKDINFTYLEATQVQDLEHNDQSIFVSTTSNHRIVAELLIAADGGRSFIRKHLNISTKETSYAQTALVSLIHSEKPHKNIAYQRFMRSGPLAFLPTADPHVSSIVWSQNNAIAQELLNLDKKAFIQRLEKAFENRLGTLKLDSELSQFPLLKRHSERYQAQRVALIGDAKHSVHPMAGQGANLGFMDAAVLNEVISECRRKTIDIGSQYTLRQYERRRKSDTLALLGMLDGIKWLFGTPHPLPTFARNWGFSLLNRSTLLKKEILHVAMGLYGDTPHTLRP